MFGLVFSKILTKTLIAIAITIGLVLLSNYDTSSEQLRNFTFDEYLGKFNEVDMNYKNLSIETDTSSQDIEIEEVRTKNTIIKGAPVRTVKISGTASHYANKFHGRLTANGEVFNMYGYTCANKELPFGTILKITNRDNGKSVLVKVNDRGPYVNDRIIDLSYQAAKSIGNLGLPRIDAEYVSKFNNVKNESQFFGYSTERPIQLFEKRNIEFFTDTDDFTSAMKIYYDLKAKTSIKDVYIFIQANHSEERYFIGNVKEEILVASKG